MKKFWAVLLGLLCIFAAGQATAADNGGLVAVKTAEGVYLSWTMDDAGEYTVFRGDEAINTTNITNYLDKGADGSAFYSVNGKEPVSVWEKQYLEIPLSAPETDLGEVDVRYCTILPKSGRKMNIGSEWFVFEKENGEMLLFTPDAQSMDVNAQATAAGSKVGTYGYNGGDNQSFFFEETAGGYLIKGKQSGLYLAVNEDGGVSIEEIGRANVFEINDGDREIPEAVLKIASTAAGSVTYSANDASVGDLDGDGEYEIVLKWDPSDSKDASQNGKTGKVFIDAYKLDGTRLWRIDLGKNVRAGAHDTQFLVYDFDGDGCAEVAFRTADGTKDGEGNIIGDIDALWTDNWSGKNLEGPLFITVFEGKSGRAIASVPYDPQSNEPSTLIFGDDYGNRSERYNACVAFLDGKKPYMVFQRGYYGGREGKGPGRTVIAAFSFDGERIEKYWRFDTMDEGNEKYIGQGNHNISVGDCDGDGCDEIFTGALTLDNDGSVLWCSFMGHGDAMHLGDFDPEHEGLEFFAVHEGETAAQRYGFTIFDAATGEILHSREAGKDTGRGLIANIGNFGGSYVAWAGSGAGKINSLGENLDLDFSSMNFRIYWDGDLYDELLDGTNIYKITGEGKQEAIFNAAADGCAANNSTKSNPCLQADIFGDWREEVIWRKADNTALRIYTTTIPTEYALPSLMSDHVYAMGVLWQNSSYNQPPHLGYYPGGVAELEIDSLSAKINGSEFSLDAAPKIENGRTLVPLRFISEAFGASVAYEDGKITVETAEKKVLMTIGSEKFTVNGEEKMLDTVPVIENDRTLVPVRAIAEILGMEVSWNGESRRITIKRSKSKAVTNSGERLTAAQVAAPRRENVKIFIAGDSTAQSYRDSMAPQAGWGQMLPLFFDESVTVDNRAMAGRSLKSFFNEGRWQSILDDACAGDYVIIQFGQNEGAWNKPERYISHEDFAVMLEEEYILPALERGLIPIIATQTQGHWFDSEANLIYPPGDEVSYASLLRDAAKKFNLTLLEVNNLSRELENSLGEKESERLHLYAAPGEYEKYPDGVSDNTHFSYYGAFEIARIAAEELEQVEDLALRRADAYRIVKEVKGEERFDVRPYGFAKEFSLAAVSDGDVFVNGVRVKDGKTEKSIVTRASAQGGFITVTAENALVEVSPIWSFEPEGGIDTSDGEYFLDIPDGTYDFTFTKADTNRGNIYINSLLVGANVDMYGTVGIPQGTRHTFKGFEISDGARIRVTEKTSRLRAVEVKRTPSIIGRKPRIYVAGDSTLCNYYPVLPETVEKDILPGTVRTGWGQMLDRFFGSGYEVVNLASSGDWARDWKDMIFPTVLANGQEGDYLVIQFGINDRNRDDKQKSTMTDALKYMIEEAEKIGVTPILVKPQPSVGYSWGSAGDFEKPNGNNGGFFDAVADTARETGCTYVDLYSLAAEHFALVGRDYVSRNYQLWNYETEEMADKLHISFAGAKKTAELFAGDVSARGILAAGKYMELTDVDDGLYTLTDGERTRYINTSGESREVRGITLAPYSEIALEEDK